MEQKPSQIHARVTGRLLCARHRSIRRGDGDEWGRQDAPLGASAINKLLHGTSHLICLLSICSEQRGRRTGAGGEAAGPGASPPALVKGQVSSLSACAWVKFTGGVLYGKYIKLLETVLGKQHQLRAAAIIRKTQELITNGKMCFKKVGEGEQSLLPSGSPTPLCEAVTKHSRLSSTSKHPQWQLKKHTIISLNLSHSFGNF